MDKNVIVNSSNRFIQTAIFIALDYLAVILAEQFSVGLRNFFLQDSILRVRPVNTYLLIPVLYILFLNIQRLYNRWRPFYKVLAKIVYASLYTTVTLIVLLYFDKVTDSTSRFFVFSFLVLSIITVTVAHYCGKKLFEKMGIFKRPVLIIGAGKTAALLYQRVLTDLRANIRVVGVLEDNQVKNPILQHLPVLGGFKDAAEVIRNYHIDNVVIAAPGLPQDKLTKLILTIHPMVKSLSVVPNLVGIPLSNIRVDSFYDEKLVVVNLRNNLESLTNRAVKRTVDIVCSFFGIIVLAPILLLIALWIRLDSHGSIIYSGKRLGQNGRPFKCYKFRSMYTNGDEILANYFQKHPEMKEEWEVYHKLDDDPRVTKAGAFLRKTSLDELPQIFNVLFGDMSLVGPRPYLLSEREDMDGAAGIILMTPPGITGLWQVSGRSEITFDERIQMETWYVRNWNIWIDIMLLFKTFKVVLARKGAY